MTPDQLQQFQAAIKAALATNPDVIRYGGTNSPDAILNAYMSGDWSNVINLTGVPFTKEQQQAAVSSAERALNPAYKATEAFDRSVVEDTLQENQQGFQQFQKDEKEVFATDKDNLDQNAADNGVLFSGSRFQKLNDLRNTYQDREAVMRGQVSDVARTNARDYQYRYGDQAAKGLSDLYKLPGTSNFNANVAGGQVKPGKTLSSVYNPNEFNFQGTVPTAQKAAVQTRAASLLGNKANKLQGLSYKTKF